MPNRDVAVRSEEVWYRPIASYQLYRRRKWFVSRRATDHFWIAVGDPHGYCTWEDAMTEANFVAKIYGH